MFAFKQQDSHPPRMFVGAVCDEGVDPLPGITAEARPPTVYNITYEQVVTGQVKVPFIERPAWISVQSEDQVHSMLAQLIKQGQKPEKKKTNKHFTSLKRMYNLYQQGLLSVARDDLITVRHTDMAGVCHEAISVPPHMFPGLVQALHMGQNLQDGKKVL